MVAHAPNYNKERLAGRAGVGGHLQINKILSQKPQNYRGDFFLAYLGF